MRVQQYTLRAFESEQIALLLGGRRHQTLVGMPQGRRKPELSLGRAYPLHIVLPSV